MDDGPVFRRVLGRDGVRVVPEVEAVDVAVVEPEADVMRMVDALARPRLQGKPRVTTVPADVRSG
jgi:hypothetical protein